MHRKSLYLQNHFSGLLECILALHKIRVISIQKGQLVVLRSSSLFWPMTVHMAQPLPTSLISSLTTLLGPGVLLTNK